MEENYKVITLNHLQNFEYEVIIQAPTQDLLTLPIHEELVLKYRLVVGKELATATVQELFKQLNFGQVYQAALKLLARRSYTVSELQKKLEAQNFEGVLIGETLKKLVTIGLLNDEQYVLTYIEHHALMGKKGPYLIKEELIQKGVLAPIIDQHLAVYEDEVQRTHIEKIVNQQLQKNKKYGPYVLKQKILVHLTHKGFSSTLVKEVLDSLDTEDSQDDPLLKNQVRKLIEKYEALSDYELKQKVTQSLARKGFSFDKISQAFDEVLED